jgi:predicted DNA binding protein
MIEARRESELMMQMPVEIGQDGSMQITYIGPADAFAATPTPDIDGVDFELLEMGEHHQDPSDGFAALTARQQKVLEAAVELGYYQNPREATHEDIADRIDRSPATVGEHLRKIESRVFSTFLRGTTTD